MEHMLGGRSYKDLIRNTFPQTEGPSVYPDKAGAVASAAKKLHFDPGIDSQRGHACAKASSAIDAGHLDFPSGLGIAKRNARALRLRAALATTIVFSNPRAVHKPPLLIL